jgi:hypothetical protein
MGLLDDAIREHLELKSLRASERPEAAPDQGATLDPLPAGDPVAPGGDAAHERLAPELRDETAAETAATRDAASVTEETAELDMHAELGGNLRGRADPTPRPHHVAPWPGAVDRDPGDAR